MVTEEQSVIVVVLAVAMAGGDGSMAGSVMGRVATATTVGADRAAALDPTTTRERPCGRGGSVGT